MTTLPIAQRIDRRPLQVLILLLLLFLGLTVVSCRSPDARPGTIDTPSSDPKPLPSAPDSDAPSDPAAALEENAETGVTDAATPAVDPADAGDATKPDAPTQAPAPPKLDRAALALAFRQRLNDWVDALDEELSEKARAILATEEELKGLLPEAHIKIMRSHLFPQNNSVIETLLNSVERQKVEIARVNSGEIQLPDEGSPGLGVPMVINSLVEISVGDLPVTLEFGRAFYINAQWKIVEISIRY